MFKRLFGKAASSLAGALWPRDRIEAFILKRYPAVAGPHLRDDYVLYGVQDGDLAFVIVLHHSADYADGIDQLIFYTRFEGYPIDEGLAESMNRNLHMSAVQLRDGALDMFAGVEPKGPFSEPALVAAFDAWKRDLMIVVTMISGKTSIAAAYGLADDARARDLASNVASAGVDGAKSDPFSTFMGAGRSLCGGCGGRGKVGFLARACPECGGAGLRAPRSR